MRVRSIVVRAPQVRPLHRHFCEFLGKWNGIPTLMKCHVDSVFEMVYESESMDPAAEELCSVVAFVDVK